MNRIKKKDNWFLQNVDLSLSVQLRFKIDKVYAKLKTRYQDIFLFENSFFGKIFCIDGFVQYTERDEKLYHETMAKEPFKHKKAIKHVLIIGGGDLLLAREILSNKVDRVTVVDIDEMVTKLTIKYASDLVGDILSDKRLHILHMDGSGYVSACTDKFDVIYIDSTDPVSCSKPLYDESFYFMCSALLKKGGFLVTQNDVPFYNPECLTAGRKALQKYFRRVKTFSAVIPSFGGGEIVFCIAGK